MASRMIGPWQNPHATYEDDMDGVRFYYIDEGDGEELRVVYGDIHACNFSSLSFYL